MNYQRGISFSTANITILLVLVAVAEASRSRVVTHHQHRVLEGGNDYSNYFNDLDDESLEEGFVIGASFVALLLLLCLICCCCSMCCGGRMGGGLTDIIALFCCYEICCDDTPGCFVPMADGGEMF